MLLHWVTEGERGQKILEARGLEEIKILSGNEQKNITQLLPLTQESLEMLERLLDFSQVIGDRLKLFCL